MRSKDAWDKAAEYAAQLQASTDQYQRQFLTLMRDEWVALANHLTAIEEGMARTRARKRA